MPSVIELSGLRKSYGGQVAIRDLSFAVERGEIFTLLGPNGAGKTSTVEILEGHRRRDGGAVSVLGHDPQDLPRDLRERIGVVLQSTGVHDSLTVAELLAMYGSWYLRPRPAGELLALVGLEGKADARAGELSGGQRRRLDIALGLVGRPELLFLDEPTTGFDPEARRAAWRMIRDLADEGTTILLTTHFMDEAQTLADRVGVMVAGELVALGGPEDLGGRDTAPAEIRFALPAGIAIADLPLPAVAKRDEHVLVHAEDPVRATHELTGWALARGVDLSGFAVSRPSLEDVYLQLTTTTAVAAEEHSR